MGKLFKLGLSFFITIVLIGSVNAQMNVYLFWGDGCPHCAAQKESFKKLQEKYDFNVIDFEVYYSRDNQNLMQEFADAYNAQFNGVPVTLIGKDYVVGANESKTEELLEKYSQKDEYTDPYKFVTGESYEEENNTDSIEDENFLKEYGGLIIFIIILLAIFGIGYYQKFYKNKK